MYECKAFKHWVYFEGVWDMLSYTLDIWAKMARYGLMEPPIYIYYINLPSSIPLLSMGVWAIDGLGKASKFTINYNKYYYEYNDFKNFMII